MKIFVLLLILSSTAYADSSSSNRFGLEIRGAYGMWVVPSDLNSDWGIISWPVMPQPHPTGFDVLYEFPNSMVLGFRQESFSTTTPASSTKITATDDYTDFKTKLDVSRTALLVGYRVDLPSGFIGLLGSFGLSKSAKLEVSDTDSTQGTKEDDTVGGTIASDYSIGIEGAYRFSVFEIGGEVGYLTFKASKFNFTGKTAIESLVPDSSADFSGAYEKIFVGVAF